MASHPTAQAAPPVAVEITDGVVTTFCRAIAPDEDPTDYPQDFELARTGLAAAIPAAIAAELRRLAEEDAARLRGLEDLADRHGYRTAAVMEEESRVRRSRDRLLARADELDGGV